MRKRPSAIVVGALVLAVAVALVAIVWWAARSPGAVPAVPVAAPPVPVARADGLPAAAPAFVGGPLSNASVPPSDAASSPGAPAESAIRGVVVDARSHPVVGAQVVIRRMPASGIGVFSDRDGAFALAGLEPGTYRVTVTASDFFEGQQEVAVPASDVRIVLESSLALHGQVVDTRGDAISQARVEASPAEAGACPEVKRCFALAQSDPAGAFRLSPLEAREYHVRVTCRGFAPAMVRATAPGDALHIALAPEATLRVRLLDETRRSVEGADVSVDNVRFRRDGNFESVTAVEADGLYVARGLSAGTFGVEARVPGRATVNAEVVLTAGKVVDLELSLTAGDELTGEVVDEPGAPVADATVVCSVGANDSETTTDAEGRFRLQVPGKPGLPIQVLAGSRRGHARETLPPGTRHVRLVVGTDRFAKGKLVAPDGRAPTACSHYLARADRADAPATEPQNLNRGEVALWTMRLLNLQTIVGTDGAFQVKVSPGPHRLEFACAEGYATIDVRDSEPLPATTLRQGASLLVTLPQAGKWLVMLEHGGLFFTRNVEAGASVVVTGLPPGTWRVGAMGPGGPLGAVVEAREGAVTEVQPKR